MGVDEYADTMRLAESPETSSEGKATAGQVLPLGCSTAGGAKGRASGVALLRQRFRGTGTEFARGYNAPEGSDVLAQPFRCSEVCQLVVRNPASDFVE